MSDWWYPGSLARQDEYAEEPRARITVNPLPPEPPPVRIGKDGAAMEPYATPQTMGALAAPYVAPVAKSLLTEPFRKGAGLLQSMQDYSASEFPLQHGVTQQTTDYDPRREAASYAAGTGFNMVGMPAFTGGALAGPTLGAGASGKMIQPQIAPAPPFYSAAQRAVDAAKLTKGTPEQWLGYLRNQPGVKQEEIGWMFGNLPKEGMLTKADMEAHAAANQVKLGEVVKGGVNKPLTGPDQQRIIDWLKANSSRADAENGQTALRKYVFDGGNAEHLEYLEGYLGVPSELIKPFHKVEQSTKFSEYTLPGGENYREMLLTLPQKLPPEGYSIAQKPDGAWSLLNAGGQQVTARPTRGALEAAVQENPGWFPKFKSSHWDEPNVLSHIRMNDREVPGVGKSLHLEEIQSDWHQAGRNKGYIGSKPPPTDDEVRKFFDLREGADPAAYRQEMMDHPAFKEGGVPDAPFKSTWADVALKRSIREAAEKNYDALSWTPGEAQAARYDLSKQVETVVYRDGKLTAIGKDGQHIINDKTVSESELVDHIGKEAADKLLKQEPHNGARALQNADLKIGGEGMKAFYDKMLIDKANALGKKHGARVEQGEVRAPQPVGIPKPHRPTTIETRPEPVHVLRITPELRAAAMKGFPLFSLGGAIMGSGVLGELAAQDDYRQ